MPNFNFRPEFVFCPVTIYFFTAMPSAAEGYKYSVMTGAVVTRQKEEEEEEEEEEEQEG